MAQKCVHQSCGKTYTDPEEECVYHPGPPIFHEGQKGKLLSPSSVLFPPPFWASEDPIDGTLTNANQVGSAANLGF